MARLAAMFLIVGCTHASPPARPAPRGPQVVLAPDGGDESRVMVEVARTRAETQRGLMFRKHLEDGHGMLFLFERPTQQSFWMRNTYVPLDIIFIRADRRVLGVVENATPLTDDPRSVDGKSQFVLEVPAGWAARHRIGPGTRVAFVDID